MMAHGCVLQACVSILLIEHARRRRRVGGHTSPRLRETAYLPASFFDERRRQVDHRLEIGDGDALVRAVEVVDAVRDVEAAQAALVEDVRVSRAARQAVADLVAAARQRGRREFDDRLVLREAVAAVLLP